MNYRKLAAGAVAASALALAGAAMAGPSNVPPVSPTVQVTYKGILGEGGDNYFGGLGTEFEVDFTYDFEVLKSAGKQTADEWLAYGGHSNGTTSPLLSVRFTANGKSFEFSGSEVGYLSYSGNKINSSGAINDYRGESNRNQSFISASLNSDRLGNHGYYQDFSVSSTAYIGEGSYNFLNYSVDAPGGGFMSSKGFRVKSVSQKVYGLESSVGGVPEPASWSLMILGVGGVGAAARRRRRSTLAVA